VIPSSFTVIPSVMNVYAWLLPSSCLLVFQSTPSALPTPLRSVLTGSILYSHPPHSIPHNHPVLSHRSPASSRPHRPHRSSTRPLAPVAYLISSSSTSPVLHHVLPLPSLGSSSLCASVRPSSQLGRPPLPEIFS